MVCSLKSANILIQGDYRAKIAGKQAPGGIRVQGTCGARHAHVQASHQMLGRLQ